MSYNYPVDIRDLVSRVNRRGDEVVRFLGLRDDLRDDVKLTHVVWGIAHGWFPLHHDRSWHGAIDIGLPDWNGETYKDAPVCAIGDGEVVHVDPFRVCSEGFDFGRVIVKHRAPGGEELFASYKHLTAIPVMVGQKIACGDLLLLGKIGSYGHFPHLSFAVASLQPIGGESDLIPECHRNSLPSGDGVYNVLRVKVNSLDAAEWPISGLQNTTGYVFNPIELVRHCRGEPYQHDIGPGSRHALSTTAAIFGRSVPPNSNTEIQVTPLRSKDLKGVGSLSAMAQDPRAPTIGKGHGDKEVVKAIQRALKACQYDMGRFGPAHDGIDGEFGKTTERIVQDFQQTKLKPLFGKDPGKQILQRFGQSATNARTDGKIDWLTLIALDVSAAAHESAPPPPAPPVVQPAPVAAATSSNEKWITLEEAKLIILKCTAVFEGAWDPQKGPNGDFNFSVLAPNFDRAGMSMGIIQWNIKSRNVFPLLEETYSKSPGDFQQCYEAGDPHRFKQYFNTDWPASYGNDVWKFTGFLSFLSSNNLNAHYLWAKKLHKPNAIQQATASPGWITKPGHQTAKKALQPELIDFFTKLGSLDAFKNVQLQRAWQTYGAKAINQLNWLKAACQQRYPHYFNKTELRTLAAIFDLTIQQGSFADAKPAIQNNIDTKTYQSQNEITKMAVTERARTSSTPWQNDCASRRLGYLNAHKTLFSDLGGEAKARSNCNYALLSENPYVIFP